MRLIEARDRGVLTNAQVKSYLLRGYSLGDEIGLDNVTPVIPPATDIDFQSKKGVRVQAGTALTDAANMGNVTGRVASVTINSGNRGGPSIPVLVASGPILINMVLVVLTQALDGVMSLGTPDENEKYVPDSMMDKTENSDPDPILVGKYVPDGDIINLYLGDNNTGAGTFYLVYTRLS